MYRIQITGTENMEMVMEMNLTYQFINKLNVVHANKTMKRVFR